jgi:hypothetical protein
MPLHDIREKPQLCCDLFHENLFRERIIDGFMCSAKLQAVRVG